MAGSNDTGLVIESWIKSSPETTEAVKRASCDTEGLKLLGVREDSFLGQTAGMYEQISVCGGAVRLLCGKGKDSLTGINALNPDGRPALFPGALVIAYDRYGGIFALNAGACAGAENGNMLYMPRDSLIWEDLDIRYAVFLRWILGASEGELEKGGWMIRNGKHITGDMTKYLEGKAAVYKCFLSEHQPREIL